MAPNMMKLMKQAASMQKDMVRIQQELAESEFEFTSGGGMVSAVATGEMTIKSVKIDPKVVDPDDVEMLEDLVLSAVDGALRVAREKSTEEMGKLTAGMGLPGGMGGFPM
ncbi:MAG: YbaB/EbfC family nucleoid-associated protein [Spartobacteria bacterium]|nr:YbaB/EbfC family nucleoid-associated protein [Spartobacteria bacterium]